MSKSSAKPGKTRKRILIALGVVLGVVVLLGLAALFFTQCRWGLFRHPTPYTIQPPKTTEQLGFERDGVSYQYNSDLVNILILGLDRAEGKTPAGFNGQADTIILATINTKTGDIALLPIPRNTSSPLPILDISGGINHMNYGPICLAHAYGQNDIQSGQLMESVVSYLLYEIPIDGFVSVDMQAISHITDYVGGVTVIVFEDFHTIADLPAGEEMLLDGEMAELFVRLRSHDYMDGTNIQRMARQKHYLEKLVQTVYEKWDGDPLYPIGLYREMQPYLSTDLKTREITYLGGRALKRGAITTLSFPGEAVYDGTEDTDFIPDGLALRALVEETWFVPVA